LDVLLIVSVPLVHSLGVAVVHATEDGNFVGLVDIGSGRKMYLKCSGRGSPTVLLVGGLRAPAEDWNISDKSKPTVFAEVAKFTRVEQPQLVIDAIREVVEAVRSGRRQMTQ
jgi:hypothetical protein